MSPFDFIIQGGPLPVCQEVVVVQYACIYAAGDIILPPQTIEFATVSVFLNTQFSAGQNGWSTLQQIWVPENVAENFGTIFQENRFPSRQAWNNTTATRSLTGEKTDSIGARLEISPRKSLYRLVQETGVLHPHKEPKLLKLWSHKTMAVHVFKGAWFFCKLYLQSAQDKEVDPHFMFFFSDDI